MITVEDESRKGERAVESALESISQDMINFYNKTSGGVDEVTSPEELLKINQAIAEATSKAVSANVSGDQEDAVVAANLGRQTISALLKSIKVSQINLSYRSIYDTIPGVTIR